MDKMTAIAMIHSVNARGSIEVLERLGDNDYKVRTGEGVLCHAIYNPFTGLWYADDVYAVIKED